MKLKTCIETQSGNIVVHLQPLLFQVKVPGHTVCFGSKTYHTATLSKDEHFPRDFSWEERDRICSQPLQSCWSSYIMNALHTDADERANESKDFLEIKQISQETVNDYIDRYKGKKLQARDFGLPRNDIIT